MSQPAKAQEPSMEEILASIRRIIADDDAAKPAPAPKADAQGAGDVGSWAPRDVSESDEDNVTPLSPSTTISSSSAPSSIVDIPDESLARADATSRVFRKSEPQAGGPTIEGSPRAPSAVRGGRTALPPGGSEHAGAALLSQAATAAVNSAFTSLAQTVLVQNSRTLEDLVKEMLRPMLKAWLDENLPALVERLVRAEIERVSRGHSG